MEVQVEVLLEYNRSLPWFGGNSDDVVRPCTCEAAATLYLDSTRLGSYKLPDLELKLDWQIREAGSLSGLFSRRSRISWFQFSKWIHIPPLSQYAKIGYLDNRFSHLDSSSGCFSRWSRISWIQFGKCIDLLPLNYLETGFGCLSAFSHLDDRYLESCEDLKSLRCNKFCLSLIVRTDWCVWWRERSRAAVSCIYWLFRSSSPDENR